ncbi:LINE-1 type transposase domain-containing protein 1 [Holothuria leucospilota]|uniref:LINE-1 type transposase domain-containing protein 1 n=1 Tax=Holothuria leucospilota TaxID=206669 RepID=A0A9Q1BJL6_HOLLE|nr:LINE-1 type transposase domain-containing protein 1 [Holothuria leucospilota]
MIAEKNPVKRGRPVGSYGRKKREELEQLSQQTRLTQSQPDNMSDTEPVDSDVEVEDLTSKFSKILERAMKKISQDLKDLDDEVRGVIENHTKQIKDLQIKNKRLAERVSTLEEKIQDLQREKESHADQINKQERFSRRNNLRIVGFKTEAEENPIEIAKEVFTKAGVESCRIERAHRDGRVVEGRNRHILVKVSFYMDKVTLLRNSRSHLSQEEYYLTDDLTLIDLKEKRKYSREVAELYRSGTKLRFLGDVGDLQTAGDFNFVFNLELDKKGGNSNTNFKARAECLALMKFSSSY